MRGEGWGGATHGTALFLFVCFFCPVCFVLSALLMLLVTVFVISLVCQGLFFTYVKNMET